MSVYVNNITINTGEYFSRDFYLDNIDGTSLNLVGYAGSSYIRKHPESLIPTAKFNVGFIDRENGRIRISLASTVTATIKPGRYVYDVLFDGTPTTTTTNFAVSSSGSDINTITFTSNKNTFSFSSANLGSFSQDLHYNVDYILSTSGTGPGTQALQVQASGTRIGLDDRVGYGADGDYDDLTVTAGVGTFYQSGGTFRYRVNNTNIPTKKSIVIEGNVLATEDISTSCQFIKTSYTYSQVGVIVEGVSSATPQISVNDISEYGVVHMGVNFNECSQFASGSSPTRDLIDNTTTRNQILSYLQLGGVVWLNVEWWNGSPSGSGCSNQTNINAMLTLLGTVIRAQSDVGFVGNATRSNEPSVINSGFPATQSNNASVIFSGGTTVYLGGSDVITTYEKIGNGVLYVSGDSNTFGGPTYPDSYYSALRNLVLYG